MQLLIKLFLVVAFLIVGATVVEQVVIRNYCEFTGTNTLPPHYDYDFKEYDCGTAGVFYIY